MLSGMLGVLYYMWFIYYSLQNKSDDEPIEDTKQEDPEALEIEEIHEDVPVKKGVMFLVLGMIIWLLILIVIRRVIDFLVLLYFH